MTTTIEVIEEIGRAGLSGVEFEITWDITPGEPMVRYYPDGSGYPGSPPMAEPTEIRVTAAWGGAEGNSWFCVRGNSKPPHWLSGSPPYMDAQFIRRTEWLDLLTEYCWRRTQTDMLDTFVEHAFEEATADMEAAQEAAWEARADMRGERY